VSTFELEQVHGSNVGALGFFCYKSARKAPGYARKRELLEQRFQEGLRLVLAMEHGRPVGFIEYSPGAYAWRAVHAPACMVVHCLWVVGRAKGKAYGSALLGSCVENARESGLAGVAAVTGRRVWLPGETLFLAQGFETADHAPPSFALPRSASEIRPRPRAPRTGRPGAGPSVPA
jgi:GNAT superfamily N-acetyltransferase